MSNTITKRTVLFARASGDCECFCFDQRTRAQHEHDNRLSIRTQVRRDDAARVYPRDLLPDGHDGRMGKWTITVEFEPENCAPCGRAPLKCASGACGCECHGDAPASREGGR